MPLSFKKAWPSFANISHFTLWQGISWLDQSSKKNNKLFFFSSKYYTNVTVQQLWKSSHPSTSATVLNYHVKEFHCKLCMIIIFPIIVMAHLHCKLTVTPRRCNRTVCFQCSTCQAVKRDFSREKKQFWQRKTWQFLITVNMPVFMGSCD